MGCSLPGSSVPGKILVCSSASYSKGSSNPGIKLVSLVCPALAGRSFTTSATWGAQEMFTYKITIMSSANTDSFISYFLASCLLFISLSCFMLLLLLLLLLLLSRFSRVRLCATPPGSTVPGILQARTLEWVAISFSNAWKWKVKVKLLSRVWLFATPWTAAQQAPPSVRFFQARVQEWGPTAFSYM